MELIYILFLATLRTSLPLFFASTGGYFSEKAGVPQIALEAYLLAGAFTAASTLHFTNSLGCAFIAAVLACVLLAQIFCSLVFIFKANAIVMGTALNLLAMGIIPLLSKIIFDSTGSTPAVTLLEVSQRHLLLLLILLVIAVLMIGYYVAEHSKWGLQIKFAGEKSDSLMSVGVSPMARRWQAVTVCAGLTALGGATLSIYLASSYSPLMSAGRGFMALAAVIFAGWSLQKTWVVVLFFGFAEALQIYLQNILQVFQVNLEIPNELIQVLPYILTLAVLLLAKNKQLAPKEIGTSL